MVRLLDFGRAAADLRDVGLMSVPDRVRFAVPQAREQLWNGLRHFVGEQARWLPEYDAVVQWLGDNGGRGLLAMGNCGRGKTLVVGRIVPQLIHHVARRIVSSFDAQAMNADPDGVKRKHLIYIDDVGTEGVSVRYGERRLVFPEVVDEAEKRGKLLLATTNLTPEELRRKYGERTMDRLRAVTVPVVFKGESLR